MKIPSIYFLAVFCLFIGGLTSLFAQSATITVKAKSQLLKDLHCYWVEDNFEFFNYTPLKKELALRKGNRFTIPFERGLNYRYITLKAEDDNNSNKLQLFDYLICPGDQIIVENNGKNSLIFSGKGAEKFDLQYKLSKIENAVFLLDKPLGDTTLLSKQSNLSPILSNKLTSLLHYNYTKRDSQLMVVEGYKGMLDSSVYNLIKLNIIGRTEQTLLKHLYMEFYRLSHKYPELKTEKLLLLDSYMQRNTRLNELSNNSFLFANELQLYFMERLKYQDWLERAFFQEWDGNTMRKESMDRVFYRHFYRNYAKIDNVQRQEIVNQITGLNYKKSLEAFLRNIADGAQLPNFQLQDTLGNVVQLSDFAGKIIILDFWYTGCGNCRILNENMKPIKDSLKDKKDLIYVNVSIDGDFEKWKKSVRSGAYTDKSDICLFTMGRKSAHPLVKFFNVMSYPRQIIVDKEMRIVETQVPRVGNEKNDKAFMALIAKLL